MNDTKRKHFIHGGHRKLHDAYIEEFEQIEIAIRRKYQSELINSGLVKEIYLRYKMNKEIQREINEYIPKGGLYLKN